MKSKRYILSLLLLLALMAIFATSFIIYLKNSSKSVPIMSGINIKKTNVEFKGLSYSKIDDYLNNIILDPPKNVDENTYDLLEGLINSDSQGIGVDIRIKAAEAILKLPIENKKRLNPILNKIREVDHDRRNGPNEMCPGSHLQCNERELSNYINLLSRSGIEIKDSEYNTIFVGEEDELTFIIKASLNPSKYISDLKNKYYKTEDGFIRFLIVELLIDVKSPEIDVLFKKALSDNFNRPNPLPDIDHRVTYPIREQAFGALRRRGYKIERRDYAFEIIAQPAQ